MTMSDDRAEQVRTVLYFASYPMTVRDIAASTGLDHTTVLHALRRLEDTVRRVDLPPHHYAKQPRFAYYLREHGD